MPPNSVMHSYVMSRGVPVDTTTFTMMSQDGLMPFGGLFAPNLKNLFRGPGQERARAANPYTAGVKSTGLGGIPQGLRMGG